MVPVSLQMNNFFSHKDSFIDFTQFESALLIGNTEGNYDISNGCGKSAVFEGILWCLFNKARVATMDDVIYWGEGACKVVFVFKHLNESYRVVRRRLRAGNTSLVEFSKQDASGGWVDISGSTPSLTNDEIIKTIKFDYKTFVNSAYFRQNDISEFTETDASRKKEILKSIIDISKWDEYEDKIRAMLKELKSESKILESKFDDYDDLLLESKKVRLDLFGAKEDLLKANESKTTHENNLESLHNKYQEIKSTLDTSTWDKTIEAISSLEKDKKVNQEKLSQVKKSKQEYKSLYTAKELEVESLGKKAHSLIIDDEVDDKVRENDKGLIEMKASLAASKEIIKTLNNITISKDNCYVCHQSIGESLYNKLHDEHHQSLNFHNSNLVFCQNKIKELEAKSQKLEELKGNKRKKEAAQSKMAGLELEVKVAKDRFNELTEQSNQLDKIIASIDSEIKINNDILNSIRNDSFKEIQTAINKEKEDVISITTQIQRLNQSIGALTEKDNSLTSKLSEKLEFKKEYTAKQKRLTTLEKMVKLLGKNGIQTILLNAIIEDLEKTANEILISICNEPFKIFLDTQRIGSDGVSVVDTLDLRVKKEGIVQNFKSLSGGEQFRISLALRIALSEISSRHGGSALEFLLLDEINSPLDRQGTESLFLNVIKSLEKKYKILVITHNDSLKERFTNVLDVTKVNGESSVNYITM